MRAPLCAEDPSEILSRAVIEDPHAFFARLRRESPLSRVAETGVHAVASWALVDEALGREADFSANLTGVLIRGHDARPDTFELPSTGATDVIATADEPDHAIHRGLVKPWLGPGRVAGLEPMLRRWTREALDGFVAAGGGDFAPIAERVPALAVARLLGLPERDVEHLRTWAMMGGDMLAGDASAERLGELARETMRMAAYLGEHLDRAGGVDEHAPLLAVLADAVREGVIPREAALGISIVLFGAGGESTAALIGSVVRWLAGDEALADRLRRDASLIPRFVEEVVRLEPPFKFHYRAVRRACRLGGFDLEPGDRLMLLWASANRDEAVFDEPDRLRLDRRYPKRHMSFGRGAHFCVGAHLARLEARVMVEALLAGTARITLVEDAPARLAPSIFVRRYEHLPIRAEAA
ncbi:MAG: cytochrome P450 [Myxococcota bacterium]